MTNYPLDDEEDEDVECPLCLDSLDDVDMAFRPCSCGYRICLFCWHHIKENLNGRCPACRKPYEENTVEFTPMKPEDIRRLNAARKQREREKKESEGFQRRHNANVRVKQRAQVHVQGMTSKIANEDTLPYLRGPEQFGRYGKIVKMFFSRRVASHPPTSSVIPPPAPSSSSGYQPVNVYVNYAHPSEAAACIQSIDGSVTPDGHKLKAIWGTTRYCPAYLRGIKCLNDNCMQAHEPGEEIEQIQQSGNAPTNSGSTSYGGHYSNHGYHHHAGSNGPGVQASTIRDEAGARNTQQAARDSMTSREEMVNLKHAWKEQGGGGSSSAKTGPALPASASWASKPAQLAAAAASASSSSSGPSSSPLATPSTSSEGRQGLSHSHSSSISSRLPKAQNHPLPPRPSNNSNTSSSATTSEKRAGKQASTDSTKSASGPSTAADAGAQDKDKAEEPERPEAQLSSASSSSSSTTTATTTTSGGAQTIVAPPTPPVSEPGSTFLPTLPATIPSGISAPPGLSLPPGLRPLTPVSEFDRTLDTFGDGLSFAFNLSASEKGKAKEGTGASVLHDLQSSGGENGSSDQSDESSQANGMKNGTAPFNLPFGIGGALQPQAEEENQPSYHGHFNPFSMGSSTDGPTFDELESSSSTFTDGPPGLSRASSSTDMSSIGLSRPPGLGGPPPGLGGPGDEGNSRHRSRFGFARQSSMERTPSGLSSGGTSMAVSELLKSAGLNGYFPGQASSATPPPGIGAALNGTISPNRPSSANSSGSGSLGFLSAAVAAAGGTPLGVFSAPSGSVVGGNSVANAPLPPPSASELPLPPPDPSKQASSSKNTLADLFPGVDLAASFSSSASLPPSLVKSLGISLESLDMTASAAASGKLPNFAPMPLGNGSSIGNQPLPPPSSLASLPEARGSSSNSSPSNVQQQSSSSTSSSSNATPIIPPPGFGASRQAQQQHAEHAQQAYRAQIAAQQAAAAAAQSAAQAARDAQAQQAQHHAQQQHGQHLSAHQQGGHVRPPSATSVSSGGASAQKAGVDAYSQFLASMHTAQSPPLPQTPGSFSERFQDPAIISYAGVNGFGGYPHHPHAPHQQQHHGFHPQPSAGGPPGLQGPPGAGNGSDQDYYSRYHPLPTPVQPQQTYNPYIPNAGVNLGGLGRMQTAQAMSQAGQFGMLRR